MKAIKTLLVAGLMSIAGVASAQFSWCPEINTDNYVRLQASFVANNLTNMKSLTGVHTDYTPKGFRAGILFGTSVSDDLPIFVEYGANFTWMHDIEDINRGVFAGGESKYTNINFAIPLNLAYKFTINDKVSVSPYAGFNFKVNALAKYKVRESLANYSMNLLDKDDVGGRDNRNIFQLGGQVGIGVNFQEFYLGWEYQGDFMKLVEAPNGDKIKNHTNYITVGYTLDL